MVGCGVVWCGGMRCGGVWCGVVGCGVGWWDEVWCGVSAVAHRRSYLWCVK